MKRPAQMDPAQPAIRAEAPGDEPCVRTVLTRAFPSDAEAGLVDALRDATRSRIALVADAGSRGVVGSVLFTPVEILGPAGTSHGMGLAPVAVLPELQRRGIGSALIRAGLDACRASGEGVVVVLGHADYYPRFGFRPAWGAGLYYREPGPNPSFMVCELAPGALAGRSGEVRYHPRFDAV